MLECAFEPWDAVIKGSSAKTPIRRALEEGLQFTGASPVQARTVPLLLSGHDVVVEAMTGSGKTLAYLIPPIYVACTKPDVKQLVTKNKQAIIALVIVPARELAQQVAKVATQLCEQLAAFGGPQLSVCSFVGGRDVAKDVEQFQTHGANVLVGTPGRLFELLVSMKSGSPLETRYLEYLILDEADKLLEFGFRAKLDAIIQKLPKQRRTGLFSATQTKELTDLARAGMRNPMLVSVRNVSAKASATVDNAKPQIPDQLRNFFAVVHLPAKLDFLVDFLKTTASKKKTLVYSLTCAGVDWLAAALTILLQGDRIPVLALHGQMQQKDRKKVHQAVTQLPSGVLVCTDVAARGLDIPEIGVVVQYEPPCDPKTFIHRIGRTARMGHDGMSVVMLTPHETDYVAYMKLQNVALQPLRDDVDDGAYEDAQDRNKLEIATHHERTLKGVLEQKAKEFASKGKGRTMRQKQKEREMKLRRKLANGGQERATVKGELCRSESILTLRRAIAAGNEDLLALATRAFVSFLRAYKEHECRYVFQLRHIDITDLVHHFALFRVPNCGEIRQMRVSLVTPLQAEFAAFATKLAEDAKQRKQQREEEQKQASAAAKEAKDDEHPEDDEQDGVGFARHRSERNNRKEELKRTSLTQKQRADLWRQAELEDLMRESYLVRLEKRGKLKSRRVDEIVGNDALEHAVMSARERRTSKRSRS